MGSKQPGAQEITTLPPDVILTVHRPISSHGFSSLLLSLDLDSDINLVHENTKGSHIPYRIRLPFLAN